MCYIGEEFNRALTLEVNLMCYIGEEFNRALTLEATKFTYCKNVCNYTLFLPPTSCTHEFSKMLYSDFRIRMWKNLFILHRGLNLKPKIKKNYNKIKGGVATLKASA
jgi:hypothetical protein